MAACPKTAHSSVSGAFPLLSRPFSDLNGPFPQAVFPLENPSGKQPMKKRGIEGFLVSLVLGQKLILGSLLSYFAESSRK